MARVAGVELQDNWRLVYALTKIKGIGFALSKKVLEDSKINESKRVKDLNSDEMAKITANIDKIAVEGDLIRKVRENVGRLRQIGSYRGIRHARGLPARGQRTRSNARTKRGKRKTVGAFKKDMLSKMQKPEKEK